MDTGKRKDRKKFASIWAALSAFMLLGGLLCFSVHAADDSVCARVKIEIKQEMTLERQAFDAHMRINNGFTHIQLEDVHVTVNFADEQRNPVIASSDRTNKDALFFIDLSSMENINNVDGSGVVAPATTADIHWLIIPTIGASDGVPQGTLYYVGATLTYTIGGEEHVTEVTPDYIYVKPLPQITLDYFLPNDVYGDDAFTSEIEPPVPFSLGVRAANNGTGVAKSLKINSAQPKIVENENGLLIGFVITGSEVNGKPFTPSLLVDFGDIQPNAASVARWIMTCSLSGRFVEFQADYTHSDELGGELTSVLEATNTHFLVREVLVDLPGRDGIMDFLGLNGETYTVYESENIDTPVTKQSGSSSLTGSGSQYTLTTPVTQGFMVVKLSDPLGGQKPIKEVIRSDGKRIKPENAWLSKTRVGSGPWQHFVCLFDANSTGSYTVYFKEPEVAHAPVLQDVNDRIGLEETTLSFFVEAGDPDGTTPSLSASPLPAGARFTDEGNGTGTFSWTPAAGQAGLYELTFRASDGALEDTKKAALTIRSLSDSDGDGMRDDWERQYFANLDRDGTGDYDGDGLTDLEEFLQGKIPTESNAPSTPQIASPVNGSEVVSLQPQLVVENSTDPDGDAITYDFEIYSDQALTTLIARGQNVVETFETTSWTVPEEQALEENTWYFWRVRATDGLGFSPWVYGSFFVNTVNEPPGPFNISSPQDGTEVDTLTPTLEVTNSFDVDEDLLTYSFLVYEDSAMTTLAASAEKVAEEIDGTTSWTVDKALDDNTRYYWRALVTDEHGLTAETASASFFVNTANDAPDAPAIQSPANTSAVNAQALDLVVTNAVDLDADILTYVFELDVVSTFDSTALINSGNLLEGFNTTAWSVSNLQDNTWYFWRVKANDGAADSPWTQGSFFVNTKNDDPTTPTLKNPGEGAWVSTLTPTLEVNPSTDIDNDPLTYRFEVYADSDLTQLIAEGVAESPGWVVPSPLSDNTWYFWTARAEDANGGASPWMEAAAFFTDSDGQNDPPSISLKEPALDFITNADSVTIRWEDADPETNAEIAIYYDTDLAGEDGVLIAGGLEEDPDGEGDTYAWDTSGLSDGTYAVYAVISDGQQSASSYAQGMITIDRTPPVVEASPAGGTYFSPQNVTLSPNEPAEIYYTTDGSEPTTESSRYVSPIEISQETTLRFLAVDGVGNQSEVFARIYAIQDTDDDGMADDWEEEHFGDLSEDGTGDADNDGLNDLEEFLQGKIPTESNAPSTPRIASPEDKSEVVSLQPELAVQNSTDPDGDAITYDFEVYSDEAMGEETLVASAADIAETPATTSWTVTQELTENTWYFWRVRATDGLGFSPWVYGSFFVNTVNEPPGAFNISSPQHGTEADTLTPTLEVTNSFDVDEDLLTYSFLVYEDSAMTTLAASKAGVAEEIDGTTSWTVDKALDDNTRYYWRAVVTDEHGLTAETAPAFFFVNTANDAPDAPAIQSPANTSAVNAQALDLVVTNAVDLDADILTYVFELDTVNTFDSTALISSGNLLEGFNTTAWSVSNLQDNTWYFWRVKANDGAADSPWTQGSFFVNTKNDNPTTPTLKNPGEGAWVSTLTPTLEVNPSTDIDNDALTYRFEVYADADLTQLIAEGVAGEPGWVVPSPLSDNTWYFWTARAEDANGGASPWMEAAAFFTDSDGQNDPPSISLKEPALDFITNADSVTIRWEDADPETNAEIAIYYDTDLAGEDGVLIAGGLEEDPDGAGDAYAWDISGLSDGTYAVYAVISDGEQSASSYAQGMITIDRTPPVVEASAAGGTYFSPQNVTLSPNEPAEIYYTTDGSEPTTESSRYVSPIEISQETTLRFLAVDGVGNQSEVFARIYAIQDTDDDGMADDWEEEHFGDLSEDGTGDADNDGLTDLEEFLQGKIPTESNAPSTPRIASPVNGSEVVSLQPELAVQNSTDPDGDAITYDFEVYSDEAMAEETLVASGFHVVETFETTSWTVPEEQALEENNWYFWRVRATDGFGFSPWVYGSFFVNTVNEPPGAFNISSPQHGTEADTLTPTLEVTNSFDVDEDVLTYSFLVYEDSAMTTLAASKAGVAEEIDGTTSWTVDKALDDNTRYYWRAVVTDEHGLTAETAPAFFFVNTANDAPDAPAIQSPANTSAVNAQSLDLVVTNAVDLDADILTYVFELDVVSTFDSTALINSGNLLEEFNTTAWSVSNLQDNTWYFWRVKANDGAADSPWTQGSFFVNTKNDDPTTPTLKNPGEGAWVSTLTPTLEVNPSMDIDNDPLTYRFEVYADSDLTQLVAEGVAESPGWVVPSPLSDNTWYFWTARSEDANGGASPWMEAAAFFTDSDGQNDPPSISLKEPALDFATNGDSVTIRWEDGDPETNAEIAIYYDTDLAGEDGVLIAGGLEEDPDGEGDTYAWDISGLSDGTYAVSAVISDGQQSASSYAPGMITIDRTPPVVEASPAGGTYFSPQNVTLSPNEPAEIYYTTDGSEPTTESSRYVSPIEISQETTLRFLAVDGVGNQSEVFARIYAIQDTDDDGMADDWEKEHFGDLSEDGTGDADNDGLTDLEEYLKGTDPRNPDTDEDGMSDAWETDYDLDPLDGADALLDADADGFTNLQEYLSNTDPRNDASKPLPPVAHAGADTNVATGSVVTLDGTQSYDPEGAMIVYEWSFTEVPDGTSVTDASLSNPAAPNPTFTPDRDGMYALLLTVSDGMLFDEDDVIITASTPNIPPNADAGVDREVLTGAPVALDGRASNDPDGKPQLLSFLWSFDAVPEQSERSDEDILNWDQAVAEFTPDVDGMYLLRLTVSDGDMAGSDTVEILAISENVAPAADAGPDLAVPLGQTAYLDGSASTDPDEGPSALTYQWSFVSVPAGSALTNSAIRNSGTVAPSFTPDVTGTFVLELMVSDGEESGYDNVAVTVTPVYKPGDLDGDGKVTLRDLRIFLASFGKCRGDIRYNPDCDFDKDGCVTFRDYQAWLYYYLKDIRSRVENSWF